MTHEFIVTQAFDDASCRQVVNGTPTVFHCHHYTTLFTQLADDASAFEGARLLAVAAEEFAERELTKYFTEHKLSDLATRLSVAEQYCVFLGLGTLQLRLEQASGTAEMTHSHVDEGWLKKWGRRDRPVNFLGQGFIAGACAAASGAPRGSYAVTETESIVSGAKVSRFRIARKEISQ